MLKLFKRNKKNASIDSTQTEAEIQQEEQNLSSSEESTELGEQPQKKGLFKRLTQGLKRTRGQFSDGLANVLLGKKTIDQALLEEIETQLLLADVGVKATSKIMADLTEKCQRKQLADSEALYHALRQELRAILQPCCQPLVVESQTKPYVILMVGINGSGKTTSIGKLAKRFANQGKKVMLAAGDTFRAAAVEQLQEWGARNEIPVIAQQSGADSASVLYDAVAAAKARDYDVLIADTAGRLHTQQGLMAELEKIKRVIAKQDPGAPHEILLVLDAGIGQNTLVQAEQFHQAIGVTGLALTKLDGTAKGGVIFACAEQLKLPIRFIGVGEGIDDLREFDSEEFIDALFTVQE